MKKLMLLTILLSAAISNSFGQGIPNGNMETWIPVTGYDSLQSFTSTNLFFKPNVTVTKSSDAHGGSFAARITGTTWLGIFPVPGGIGTNASVDFVTFTLSGGYPYTDRPNAFTGWYKYEPSNNDSSLLLAVFTKWNGTKRDTIGVAPYTGKNTSGAYKEFYSNVLYFSSENPDTAFVMALTSYNFLAAHIASVLFVDDLNFTFNVGIPEVKTSDEVIVTYPNPARDRFTIELQNNHRTSSLQIFDVLGNKVKQVKVESNTILLATNSFADGLYFYQLEDKDNNTIASGKFSVKH